MTINENLSQETLERIQRSNCNDLGELIDEANNEKDTKCFDFNSKL